MVKFLGGFLLGLIRPGMRAKVMLPGLELEDRACSLEMVVAVGRCFSLFIGLI